MSDSVASAQDIVEAIDRHMLGQLEAGGVLDYSIQGRRITRYSVTELLRLRDYYAQVAARESGAGGIVFGQFDPGR